MSGLQLSENEYSLVCLVLEEPPMSQADLTRLTSLRLFLEEDEADALVTELLSRDVLAPEEDRIVSHVTREAADQAAIHRTLNTFTPRWPAPIPPPEEPAPEPPPRPKKRVWRWVILLLLCAVAAAAAVWFFLLRDSYPKLVTFEDGRTFSQLAKPESEVQKAAAQYLMDYARDQAWFGDPILQSLELTTMLEFAIDPLWATQVEAYESYAEIIGDDIAARHRGVVIFAEVEVVFTDDAPALLEDGAYLYRLYLSEEDGVWTVAEMEQTEMGSDFFVKSDDVTIQDRTFTLSRWGRNLTGGSCQIYAVTAYDGETHQILFLTEEPVQQSSALPVTIYDLNNDGCQDLMFQGNYQLCYLYNSEEDAFRLSPLLSGLWLQYDPALPGTVTYSAFSLSEGSSTRYFFSRVETDGTLTELAAMTAAIVPAEEGEGVTYRYTYYEGGNAVAAFDHIIDDLEALSGYDLAMAILAPGLIWDNIILGAAEDAGCLDLPLPTYSSSYAANGGIQFLLGDDQFSLYSTPNGNLLLRDGERTQVLPGSPDQVFILDCDGDGDRDFLTTLSPGSIPFFLVNKGLDWSTVPLDLSGLVEDFNANTTVTYSEEETGETFTIAYAGEYGSAACACPTEALSSSSPHFRPDTAAISSACTVQGVQSLGQERRITVSFPVILTQDGVWRDLDASFCCEVTLSSPGGDTWDLHSMQLVRQLGDH